MDVEIYSKSEEPLPEFEGSGGGVEREDSAWVAI